MSRIFKFIAKYRGINSKSCIKPPSRVISRNNSKIQDYGGKKQSGKLSLKRKMIAWLFITWLITLKYIWPFINQIITLNTIYISAKIIKKPHG